MKTISYDKPLERSECKMVHEDDVEKLVELLLLELDKIKKISFEIILINDQSTDNSYNICKKLYNLNDDKIVFKNTFDKEYDYIVLNM